MIFCDANRCYISRFRQALYHSQDLILNCSCYLHDRLMEISSSLHSRHGSSRDLCHVGWDTPKTHPTWAGRENNSGKDDDGNGLGEIKYSYGRTGAGKCKKTILTGLRVTLSIVSLFLLLQIIGSRIIILASTESICLLPYRLCLSNFESEFILTYHLHAVVSPLKRLLLSPSLLPFSSVLYLKLTLRKHVPRRP